MEDMIVRIFRCFAAVMAAAVALLLQSCAGYSDIKISDAEVVNVRATSLRSAEVRIGLTIDNPTKAELKVAEIRGAIRREGEPFASFHSEDTLRIPAGESVNRLCTIKAELDSSVSLLEAGLSIAEGGIGDMTADVFADAYKGRMRIKVRKKNIPLETLLGKLK